MCEACQYDKCGTYRTEDNLIANGNSTVKLRHRIVPMAIILCNDLHDGTMVQHIEIRICRLAKSKTRNVHASQG